MCPTIGLIICLSGLTTLRSSRNIIFWLIITCRRACVSVASGGGFCERARLPGRSAAGGRLRCPAPEPSPGVLEHQRNAQPSNAQRTTTTTTTVTPTTTQRNLQYNDGRQHEHRTIASNRASPGCSNLRYLDLVECRICQSYLRVSFW